jgi:transcriptional regulator with XRE-family HTH domain
MQLNPHSLKAWRQARGLTTTQLSNAVPLERSVLTRFEAGEAQPSIKTLRRLAEILVIPAEALVGPDTLDLTAWPFARGRKRVAA